jgi:hypothetical protein
MVSVALKGLNPLPGGGCGGLMLTLGMWRARCAGTIRNAYKHLHNDRNKLIDPKWIEDGKGDMDLLPSS